MSSLQDWAAKAAARIRDEYAHEFSMRRRMYHPTEARLAAIIETFAEPLLKIVRDAQRLHYHCEDSWYCCGKCTHPDHSHDEYDFLASHEGEAPRTSGVCNCGADAWNARVDAALTGSKL